MIQELIKFQYQEKVRSVCMGFSDPVCSIKHVFNNRIVTAVNMAPHDGEIDVQDEGIECFIFVDALHNFPTYGAISLAKRADRSVNRVRDTGAWRHFHGCQGSNCCFPEWFDFNATFCEDVNCQHTGATAIPEKRSPFCWKCYPWLQ